MPETDVAHSITHKPGFFNWVDVATTDTAAGLDFYHKLFGWTSQDIPTGPDSVYTMLSLDGKLAGALHKLDPERQKQGVPPHWLLYVASDNCDATVSKIKANGGSVHAEPFDVMDAGRMAVVADPNGAIFAIWQAKAHSGAGIVNEVGSMSWHELMSTDTAKAVAFYTTVFGWTTQIKHMGGFDYTVFLIGEKNVGGMMPMPAEMKGVPSNWTVYFTVADCDASVKKVTAIGGKIVAPAMAIPGLGKFAIVSDGQGAKFGIITYEQQ